MIPNCKRSKPDKGAGAATSTTSYKRDSISSELDYGLKMIYPFEKQYASRTGFGKAPLPLRRDGWVLWPTIFAFCVPLIISLAADFSWDIEPPTSIASFILLLVYLLSPIAGFAICVWCLFNLRWKAFFSYAALPIFFYMQMYYPHVGSADISRYIYFFSHRAVYEKYIVASSEAEKPLVAWFFWRDASPMFGQILVYIVYDESDEFAKPNVLRSPEWLARAQKAYIAAFGYPAGTPMPDDADHLLGHYYVVFITS